VKDQMVGDALNCKDSILVAGEREGTGAGLRDSQR
jgi:hypothetical protein